MSTPYDSQQVKTILAERGAQVEAYLQHCLDAIPMQGRLKEAMYYPKSLKIAPFCAIIRLR